MKSTFTLITFFLSSFYSLHAQEYNVVESSEDSLYVMDGNANIIEKLGITETGGNAIQGYTGMALNPANGLIYVAVKATPRYLATMNEATNTITKIGDLSDKIAGIAFNPQGVLYGITGDGGATPNRLYTIDIATAVMTEVADLSGVASNDGETIAFNTTDNEIYRLAGGTYLYKITEGTFNQTLVTDNLTSGGISGHAMYYDGTNFITLSNAMCTMTATGAQTNCTILSEDFKGITLRGVAETPSLEQTSVKVYPNPTSTHVTIERSEGSSEEFMITDGSGKLLKKGTLGSLTTKVDVSDLSTGLYFVTVGNGKTKLMIQ